MTERDRLKLIQELNDRLLYLSGDAREEFLSYLNVLLEAYPSPRKVLYGEEAIKAMKP